MSTVLRRVLKNRWRMLVAMVVIGVLVQWMYIALFPSYSKSFSGAEEMFAQMPEALKEAFNIESFSFDTIEKFLTIEMYSFFWPILTVLLVLSLVGSAFAGEVERETVQLTAGQPVSRSAAFLGTVGAAAVIFTAFNVAVTLVVFPLCALHGIEFLPAHFLAIGVMGELMGLGVLGLATAVSAFLSDKGRVYMVMGGLLLAMYALNIVSGLQDSLDGLKYASVFHYFDASAFLVRGEYGGTAASVFGGMLGLGVALGWWRWRQRDLV